MSFVGLLLVVRRRRQDGPTHSDLIHFNPNHSIAFQLPARFLRHDSQIMNFYKTFRSGLPAAASLFILPYSASAELVGYWKLDDNFDDSSGKGNNGVFFGGTTYEADTPTALVGGKSVAFDGQAGTYGAINSGTGGMALTTLPSYSVSMWVKGEGTANSDDRVFSEGSSTDNNPLFNVGTHNGSADGTVDIYIRNGGGGETLNHGHSPGTAFDNNWHHIAFIGGSDKQLDLYIDGVFDTTFDYANVPDFTPDTTTIGGILRAGDCCNFLGSIDEVAMWDSDLTPVEIANLALGTPADDIGSPPEDFDDDGMPNNWEMANDLDPNDDGSVDPDNGPDGDPDSDNSRNAEEFANGTDPRNDDSDDDDLNDGAEVLAGTDPTKPDTDGDTLNDGAEQTGGTNPLLKDTDGDGIADNDELTNGTIPTDIESPPIGGLLSAYWPLDSTDGTITPDEGPNGYHLDLMNMDASNFIIDEGHAVASFNGADTLLARIHSVDDDLPISQNPAYTISMWVKITGTGQNDLRFFSEGSTISGNPLLNLGTRNDGSDDSLDVFLRDGGGPPHQFSTAQPLDGTWRHLAYTHNDANKKIQLYLDGVLDREDWTFKDLTSPDIDTTSIGGILRADPSHWVDGLVDDVSLWKGVMSPAKITELASGKTPDEIAGTASFEVTSINRDAAGNVTITWNSRPGAVYGVWGSLNLDEPWNELDDSYGSQGNQTSYTLSAGTPFLDPAIEPRIFFRITK